MRITIWITALALSTSCGTVDGADGVDAGPTPDARPCPPGTVPVPGTTDACIERLERGTAEWDAASTTCLGIGRRLCTEDEWAATCAAATGVENMTNDDAGVNLEWEWVDGEAGGVAPRRGYATCDDVSEGAILDPVDYRCCADR